MLEEVILDGLKIPGVNAPARTKEDSIKEVNQVAEKERHAMIGKAFEGLIKNLYVGKGDFNDMLTASANMRGALELMRIDGKAMTPDMLDKAMFDLTRMQLDMLTPSRAEFINMRKGWRTEKMFNETARLTDRNIGGLNVGVGDFLNPVGKKSAIPTFTTALPKK